MNKNIFTNRVTRSILTFFTVVSLFSSYTVYDESRVAYAKTAEGPSVVQCATTYSLGFLDFLNTAISFGGFGENFLGYLDDIFARSSCHASDIMSLDQGQGKIKRLIQQAYLKCEYDKIPGLQTAYYKADAEIYYLRHVINKDVSFKDIASVLFGVSDVTVEDLKAVPEIASMFFVDVYSDLKSKYSTNVGGDVKFDEFYKSLELKYSDKKYEYLLCGELSDWKRVKEKWDEFINNWGGIKEGGQQLTQDVIAEYKKMEKTAISMPPSSFKSFLGNTFQATINGVTPEDGFAEIYKNAEGYVGNRTPDLSTLYNTMTNAGDRYKFDVDRATIEAKYKALYQGVSDAAISSFLNNLDILIAAVKDTKIPIDNVTGCSESVLDKQCK